MSAVYCILLSFLFFKFFFYFFFLLFFKSVENQTSAASSVTAGVEKSSTGIYQSHCLWGYVNVPLAFLACLG